MSMLDYFLESSDSFESYNESYGSMNDELDRITDIQMESVVSIPCYDNDPFDAMLRVANECAINHNNLVNAIAMDELRYLRESGEEKDDSKEDKVRIIMKIKKFIMSLQGKIQDIVRKIIDKFDEWNKKDKTFLKKFKDDILKAGNNNLKVKGKAYDYIDLGACGFYKDIDPNKATTDAQKAMLKFVTTGGSGTVSSELLKSFNKSKKNIQPEIIKSITGKKPGDETSVRKYMHDYFRNGSEKTDVGKFTSAIATSAVTAISTAKKDKQDVKTAFRAAQDVIRALLKQANSIDAKVKGDRDATKTNKAILAAFSEYVKIYSSTLSIVFAAHTKAIAERNRTYKAICKAAVSQNKKNAKISGDDEDEDEPTWGDIL